MAGKDYNRRPNGQFGPGNDGGARPKDVLKEYRELPDIPDKAAALMDRLYKRAMSDSGESNQAAKLWFDRVDGLPVARSIVETTEPQDRELVVGSLTDNHNGTGESEG